MPSQRPLNALSACLLSIVPLTVVLSSFIFVELFVSFEADPDYSYLLNGVDLLILWSPGQWDHPGTTMQLLSAIVVAVVGIARAPFTGQWPIDDALRNPELYLHAVNSCVATLAAAAVFGFGARLRACTGSMFVALVGQLSILMSFPVMLSLAHATPETLLVPLTIFLATVLTPVVLADHSSPPARGTIVAVGMLLGACLATKASAISLLLAVFYYRGRRAQLTALAVAAGSVLLFTLPIWRHYRDILSYLVDIATHTGIHGTGDAGLPSSATLLANLSAIYESLPVAFVAVGLCLALIIGRRFLGRHEIDIPDRTFLVSGAIIALHLLLVAKHPGTHYLVPVVAIVALANAAIVDALVLQQQRLRWISAITACALVAVGIQRNAIDTEHWIMGEHRGRSADGDLLARARASGCQIIPYYDGPMPEYKLLFGSNFSGGHLGERLQKLYPDFLTYEMSRPPTFRDFVADLSMKEASARMAKARCVYLLGSPLERFDVPLNIPRDDLVLIDRADDAGGDVLFALRRLPDGTAIAADAARR
jgi:hypothetical protein